MLALHIQVFLALCTIHVHKEGGRYVDGGKLMWGIGWFYTWREVCVKF